jgi:hypothetical protein
MERNSGYFLVWRKIWKSPVFKNLKQCAIWIYMISQATHQDKTLNFLDNKIFVKKAELIFPLRKNAEIWGITYSEMRTFIKRLKNRKMINVRMHHLLPTSNHPSRKISIIECLNYDKYQYLEDVQSPQHQLSPYTNTLNTNTNISIGSSKDVNNGYKSVGEWGQYTILEKNGKKYQKHKWKNEPMKEYDESNT